MKITRQHTLWIVILAILAGIALFIVRARVVGYELPQAFSDRQILGQPHP
jgi:hypothetical protein